MSATLLNEHDANQGAQSKGEFLGMTGNSAWYLLGSAGTTVLMVILLWGVFDVSLLLCLTLGVVLCLLSVVYVFALKNNRAAHYDTDFFEAVLVEASLIELTFGPRARRIANPFRAATDPNDAAEERTVTPAAERSRGRRGFSKAATTGAAFSVLANGDAPETPDRKRGRRAAIADTVPRAEFDQVRAELRDAEDRLEEALCEREDD